jgi:hypothetical protein
MKHEALARNGEHDLAPARRPRLEPHAVSRSQRGPHRPALGNKLEGTGGEGAAQHLDEFRSGGSTGRPRGV